jgi:hypothetical protein
LKQPLKQDSLASSFAANIQCYSFNCLQNSASKMSFTSKPVVTYFPLPFHGRGGAIYLLLADAGVEYEKHNIQFGDWPAKKKEFIASGKSLNGTLPFIELDGMTYAHQVPILRVLSRRLGKQTY